MISSKCSSHFIQAYDGYKKSLEKRRVEQLRRKEKIDVQNFKKDVYRTSPTHIRTHSSVYEDIAFPDKCPQVEALIEVDECDEDKELEERCVWDKELQEKKKNAYTESLSALHLEKLQKLTARRRTLPDNVFSLLRDKCKEVKTQRTVHTIAYEEEEEDNQKVENVRSFEAINEEEEKLPKETKLLIRRSRKLSATLIPRQHERKNKLEGNLTVTYKDEIPGRRSLPDIQSTQNVNNSNNRRRSSNGIYERSGSLPALTKRCDSRTSQASIDYDNNKKNRKDSCCNDMQEEINRIPYPKRPAKLIEPYNIKPIPPKIEKKVKRSNEEMKACQYLKSEVMSNTCQCSKCQRRKEICSNCKMSKKIDF